MAGVEQDTDTSLLEELDFVPACDNPLHEIAHPLHQPATWLMSITCVYCRRVEDNMLRCDEAVQGVYNAGYFTCWNCVCVNRLIDPDVRFECVPLVP